MTLEEFVKYFEFSLDYVSDEDGDNCYKLVDDCGVNLGGIEDDYLYSVEDIIERLDMYIRDYIITELCWDLAELQGENKELVASQFTNKTLDDLVLECKEHGIGYPEIVDCIIDPSLIIT